MCNKNNLYIFFFYFVLLDSRAKTFSDSQCFWTSKHLNNDLIVWRRNLDKYVKKIRNNIQNKISSSRHMAYKFLPYLVFNTTQSIESICQMHERTNSDRHC